MHEGLNVVHLIGNVRGEPSTFKTNGKPSFVRFSLFVETVEDVDGVERKSCSLLPIITWHRIESLSKNLKDGAYIYVGGRLRSTKIFDKKSKRDIVKVHVQGDSIVFLGKRPTMARLKR